MTSLRNNYEAIKALLNYGYLDVMFERVQFKRINHPNELLGETWQRLTNYQVIYDVDPEQLKSKEDIEKEYQGLDPDDIKRIQESKKQN